MLVILGFIIVTAAVLGGFIMAGGHPVHLIQVSEFIVISPPSSWPCSAA